MTDPKENQSEVMFIDKELDEATERYLEYTLNLTGEEYTQYRQDLRNTDFYDIED